MNPLRRFITLIICLSIVSISLVSLASDAESLEIGDLINFGEFHNEPILWQIVDFDDNGNPLLLSKEIIDLNPFDAAGRKHSPDGYYNWAQYYGSNQWEISTLRQWLNSTRKNINWQLNPPSEDNVFEGMNAYANKLDVILKRLEDFSHNKDSEFIIIDNKGLDQSKWARDNYDWSSREDELKEIQEDLYKKRYYIVKGGDFRVTSMKAEIDSVFQEIGLVVTNRATAEDPRSKFLEDMKPLYEEGDYNGIIKYLEEKQYTIIHPYDFYSHGISIINSELDH